MNGQNNVLLAESEPLAAELLERSLCALGYQVTVCRSGNEALRLAQQTPPTAVLTALALPELDGAALCRLLRQQSATQGIPTLLILDPASQIPQVPEADEFLFRPFAEATARTALGLPINTACSL